MTRALVFAVVSTLLLGTAARAADAPTITQAELVRRTQALFDAVAPGNRAPWKRYFADDAIVNDEKGREMNKAALLADLQPLPAGYGGSITVAKAKSRFAPGVAVLTFDTNETETIYGRVLHARYHETDTWLYRNRLWQIVASQVLRYYEDPAVGTISARLLRDYVGAYRLAPGIVMRVTRRGNALYAQRAPGKPYRLLPESADLFFRPGVEGRRLFHRDAAGQVDMLIDRRNNEDLLWKRIG